MAREKSRETWNHDIVYDDPEIATEIENAKLITEEQISLYVGMFVQHARFGKGELLGWNGSGDQLKFVLRFPKHGTKTILARFCELT